MEHNGGPYDRDPYGSGQADGDNGGYAEDPAARGDEHAQFYGQSPYGQSPYGQSPYGQSPYNASFDGGYEQSAYGGSPYSREYVQSGNGREDGGAARGERGEYARGGEGYDANAHARGGEGYDANAHARGGEGYDANAHARGGEGYDANAYARGGEGYDANAYARGGEGYDANAYARGGEGYDANAYAHEGYGREQDMRSGYGREGYARQGYGGDYDADMDGRGYGRGSDAYGGTGRMQAPRGDDPYMSDTARMRMSDTARMRMQRDGYHMDAGAEDFTEAYDDEDEYGARRQRPKKKKKRSKFSRFMRGLGAYIAELPAKTLVIFGGSVAVLLVGVILLVMLLPKEPREEDASDGQLSLSDITPTPSLAPTMEPLPTEQPTPSPDPDPLNGATLAKVGEEHDIIPTVQERLVELGYMETPEGGYTTRYGPATKTAVRLFQIKNLTDYNDWDGILGAGTYNLLMSETAKAFYLARGDGDDRTRDITRLVELVQQLQERLITLGYLAPGSATGRYGESTVTAVRTFQQFHGLAMDGQAGQATLKQIYASDAMDATTGAANDRSKLTPTPAADDPAAGGATGAASTAPDTPSPDAGAPTPTVNENGVVVY